MKLVRFWLRCFAQGGVVAGPIFGVLAIGLAWHTGSFIHHASRAEGTVIKLTQHSDQEGAVTYLPTFTFTTPSGQTVTKDSGTGNNPPVFLEGEHVRVLFSPDNPNDAEIDSAYQLWALPVGFGAISVISTPLAYLLLRRPQIANAPGPFGGK